MKYLKNSLIFLIILLFAFSTFAFSEKRNLSTPLSRLCGHWVDKDKKIHYYFGPITDKINMTGHLVVVIPDKDTIKKFFEILLKSIVKPSEDEKEAANELIESVMAIAEEAIYLQYKLISQKPNGLEINIEIIDMPKIFYQPPFFWDYKKNMNVDKKGKYIKFKPFSQWALEEFTKEEKEAYILWKSEWTYLDSKTSPEDVK